MRYNVIENERLHETVCCMNHPTGARILVEPKKGYSSKYAIFGTRYGSIDNRFRVDGGLVEVPEGIAHFLEHKLFESEDGDAFERFALTGASANAYTSFDRTCYLFSCTQNFEQSLEVLLDFVQSPYFTEKTVRKEQGIIGQEIRMYLDDPSWRVFFNLLEALYVHHPVKIDIAGTESSISKITADLLYKCYQSFYNLNNMVLSVSGDVDPEAVFEIADRLLKPCGAMAVRAEQVEEPDTIVKKRVEQTLSVSVPLFCIGFKDKPCEGAAAAKKEAVNAILHEIVAGDSSMFYRRMYDEGMINSSFGLQYFDGRGFASTVVSGESRKPDEVWSEFLGEIERLKKEGIPGEDFERAKKAVFGRLAGHYDSVDEVANSLAGGYFMNMGPFDIVEAAASVSPEDVDQSLHESFDESRSALSVILPA